MRLLSVDKNQGLAPIFIVAYVILWTANILNAATLPPGIESVPTTRSNEINRVISSIISEVTENNLARIDKYLTQEDQLRIGSLSSFVNADLDSSISFFKKEWEKRYRTPFSPTDLEHILNPTFIDVVQGKVRNPDLLDFWPVDPSPDIQYPRDLTEDSSLPPEGANIAIAYMRGAGEPIALTFVQEGSWKLELPDNINEYRIQTNLIIQFRSLSGVWEVWPRDVRDAYRVMTKKIMTAIYGIANYRQ